MTVPAEIEVRVLGSLIEKQITTPEYYPLTVRMMSGTKTRVQNLCNSAHSML